MTPFLSICIPTYNRAPLLNYALTNLEACERFPFSFEVVVSDNASTDESANVIADHCARKPYIRSFRQQENRGFEPNWMNAIRQARGTYMIYLADDDGLVAENLLQHLTHLRDNPNVVARYADHIAYDDETGTELHRYFHFPTPTSFEPNNPLGLIDFVLRNQVYPEVGIYHRETYLRAHSFVRNGIPFHLWMYHLSRYGAVEFDLLPFMREHRVLKRQFRREYWSNTELQHQYIGDELRNSLESITLMAFQDSGRTHLPPDQVFNYKLLIDRFLHNRTTLNIQRACTNKDWILAVELRRRLVLWYGPDSQDQQIRDLINISIPAACQAIYKTFVSLSAASGVLFHGFRSQQVAEHFRNYYPDVPILPEKELTALANSNQCPLVVAKTLHDEKAIPELILPGFRMAFDQLLDVYRINRNALDLSQL